MHEIFSIFYRNCCFCPRKATYTNNKPANDHVEATELDRELPNSFNSNLSFFI